MSSDPPAGKPAEPTERPEEDVGQGKTKPVDEQAQEEAAEVREESGGYD